MPDLELVISSRFKSLLPPLTDDERRQLEINIDGDGRVIDPILFWAVAGKNVIVDGMHRYPIAKRKGVPFSVKEMEFESQEDAELWIVDHALGKRNLLNAIQIRKARGEMYDRVKQQDGGHGNLIPGGPTHSEGQNVPPRKSGKNAKKPTERESSVANLSEKAGVSAKTLQRDAKFVAMLVKLSEPVKRAIEAGILKVSDSELKSLSERSASDQQDIARQVRTGQKQSVAAAMGLKVKIPKPECEISESGKHTWESDGNGSRFCSDCKEDHPDNPKEKKRVKGGKEVASAAKLVDQLVRQHISPAVRGIDAIAAALGGKGECYKAADEALETILQSLKKMRAGEK